MARAFARKGANRPQLVHSARVSLLARVDKYNDPDNLEWDWNNINDKWARYALSAVQDLVVAERERDALRMAVKTLLENSGGLTSTEEGTDTHVLVRREDLEALAQVQKHKRNQGG